MIELKYKIVKNAEFNLGLSKIGKFPFKTVQNSLTIKRILKALEKEAEIMQPVFKLIVDQFALKDEKGSLIPVPGTEDTFQVKENVEGYRKALKDFEETSFEIRSPKLKFSDLDGVGLSAVELLALEDLIEGMDEEIEMKAELEKVSA